MCATCGCAVDSGHDHGGHEAADHHHATPASRTIRLEQDVLAKNDLLAARNRDQLIGARILALNLMSSPGAGKTTLLVRTINDLGSEVPICVVEGDQETALDAERIATTSAPVVQINTGSGCHLDASMLAGGIATLDPPHGSILMVENVGNLVCPAMFDLGEHARVVIMSVTEGADKPLKYPMMFRSADLVVLNKIDLAPYVDFDIGACLTAVARVNPRARVLQVSATRGHGLDQWYSWLRELRQTI